MRKPNPRIDQDSDLGRALQQARQDLPSSAHTDALLRDLKAQIAAGAAPGDDGIGDGITAAKSALGAKGSALIAGLALIGGTGLWLSLSPPAAPAPAPPTAPKAQPPAPVAAPAPKREPLPAPVPAPDLNPPPATPAAAATPTATAAEPRVQPKDTAGPRRRRAEATRSAHPDPRASHATAATAVDPTGEVSLIDNARKLLARDPDGALSPLREHARRFPQGILAQERELMRIEALTATGQAEAATRAARAFIGRFANSPHRRRIETLTNISEAPRQSAATDHNPDGEPLPTP